MKSLVRQSQTKRNARFLNDPVPAPNSRLNLPDVIIPQALIERRERRHILGPNLTVEDFRDQVLGSGQQMIVIDLRLLETPLDPAGVIIRRVRGNLGAIQVKRYAAMEVQVALKRLQINDPHRAYVGRIINFVLFHHTAGALDDAADARLPDEHMVRFLGEHEPASPRERVEARLRQGAKLKFSVAVGKKCEHEK